MHSHQYSPSHIQSKISHTISKELTLINLIRVFHYSNPSFLQIVFRLKKCKLFL